MAWLPDLWEWRETHEQEVREEALGMSGVLRVLGKGADWYVEQEGAGGCWLGDKVGCAQMEGGQEGCGEPGEVGKQGLVRTATWYRSQEEF